MASTLGVHNPLRYRGYVYDQETGLYYLQSRYYNPELGRFISADNPAYLGANGGISAYNLFAYCGNNPNLSYSGTKSSSGTSAIAYDALIPAYNHNNFHVPLSFATGLLTPETRNLPSWLSVYGFYVKGTLGWGYTHNEGYSLASFSIGILDTKFHTPKWFDFLPADHLANPNIYLGIGTWNANASIGAGFSGIAEILSGTIGIQFGDAVNFGAKGYIGIGLTFDFTNGLRFGAGLGLEFEVYIDVDWYELFN